MDEIRFSVDFAEEPDPAEIPEETTCANLAIFVDDDCLTRNRPRRPRLAQATESVFGPVAGLADWFIENWGPILWETRTPFKKSGFGEAGAEKPALPGYQEAFEHWYPYFDDHPDADIAQLADWQHRHLLGHACSNLALPSIVIVPEDRNVVLAVDRMPTRSQGSLEFLANDDSPRSRSLHVCRKTAFQESARDFIEQTLARAGADARFGRWADWLQERWRQAQIEESDPKRRLAWMLGDVSAQRVAELEETRPSLAGGLKQVLLDCKTVAVRTELQPIEAIVEEFALQPDQTLSSNETAGWQSIARESVSLARPEFAQGYQLARLVRRKLALRDGPIVDLAKTLDRLDVSIEEERATALFRVAACAPSGKRAHLIPSSIDDRLSGFAGRRFAIAAGLGRLLWQARIAGDGPICVAQGDHAMLSQSRRANAFAAEFLLPREAVEHVDPDSLDDVSRLSDRYGVSRTAVVHHASNVKNAHDNIWK